MTKWCTVLLLLFANVFMTTAWYGHLKFGHAPLWKVVLLSWLIALPEYLFQVPANRLGYQHFSALQLKTLQEVIGLVVFLAFSHFFFQERLALRHVLGLALVSAGVAVTFHK